MANIIKSTTNTFHLCSAGNRTDLLFYNRDEFISGMNLVAIAALQSRARILAFCLMDNHFHFILSADSEEMVIEFAVRISQLYKRRMAACHLTREPIKWSYFHIDTEVHLKYAIAYTLKNPTHALYRNLPVYYPWSSSSLYFCDDMEKQTRLAMYRTVHQVGTVKMRHLAKSRHTFPSRWLVTNYDFIWPGNYVDIPAVENLFHTSREFLYYLSFTKKENFQDESCQSRRICIPDQELRQHAVQLCREMFHRTALTDLALGERLQLKKQLSFQYGCPDKQIARILHLKFEI